ncbi:MAG TPA: histidinol dehydrogenase [Firmicutes bacterium]|jgi:histidinol dehydrogenase|nr:histidinol dehydrogenase [Bacillota bacterium]
MRVLKTAIDREEIRLLLARRPFPAETEEEIRRTVEDILSRVRQEGDKALVDYTKAFDGVDLTTAGIRVKEEELQAARGKVAPEFLAALHTAKENILRYHRQQVSRSWTIYEEEGIVLGQRYLPLDTVGLYVPGGTGGKTPLVSSVLMNALPAVVAGVSRIIMCTPPTQNGTVEPHILAAALEAGVTEVYKLGGAQAVAAMAFGTGTVPRVDKIVGPGNNYVTMAKRLVYGEVGLDFLAGPSEIIIVADETASPRLVAADLLSQAEHGPVDEAAATLLTPSASLLAETAREVERQLQALSRKEIARASLEKNGGLILTRDLAEAVDLANFAAPEHLELMVAEPYYWLTKIRHAGAIFLGSFTPESVGDYVAGTNHVLPTGGTARFASALSVDDFVKKSSFVAYSSEGLEKFGPAAVALARVEGLEAHARAVEIRLEDIEGRGKN